MHCFSKQGHNRQECSFHVPASHKSRASQSQASLRLFFKLSSSVNSSGPINYGSLANFFFFKKVPHQKDYKTPVYDGEQWTKKFSGIRIKRVLKGKNRWQRLKINSLTYSLNKETGLLSIVHVGHVIHLKVFMRTHTITPFGANTGKHKSLGKCSNTVLWSFAEEIPGSM